MGTSISNTQRAFLAAYEECGCIVKAAAAAGLSRDLHYRWIKEPFYKEAFEIADQVFGDIIEGHARQLVREGVEETVYFQGIPCGTRVRYPQSLMIRVLEAQKPQKYRQNHHIDAEITHTGLASLTDAELERIATGSGGGITPPAEKPEQDPDVLPG